MTKMTYTDGYRVIRNAFSDARHMGGIASLAVDEVLLLTILHLYKFHRLDGKINQLNDDADVINALVDACHDSSIDGSFYYTQVYDNIRSVIINPDGRVLVNFLRVISSIRFEWYEEHFPQLFDDILFSLSEQMCPRGLYLQPKELSELIFSLVNIPNNAKVYDPFTGVASFAIDLPDDAVFTGQEMNGNSYSIALLRLMANCKKGFTIYNEDSVSHWHRKSQYANNEDSKYDLIVSFPPLGMRLDSQNADLIGEWEGRQISIEEYLISNGLFSLSHSGQLAAVFSPSMLFQGGNTGRFRENIIRSGRISTVIELPTGLLSMTGIGLCAIILNNESDKSGKVKLVDAKSFSERQGRKNVLKVKELLAAIQSEDPECVKNVSLEEIGQQDFILSPNRYFSRPEDQIQIPEGFKLVPLRDIFDIYRGQTSQLSECRMIKGRDLATKNTFDPISLSNLDVEELRNGRCRILNEECLLVLRVGQLKPTFYKPEDNIPISCNPNITALRALNVVYYPYIISELRKDYVKKQVEMLSVGVAMRSISPNDLLSIKILLPCLLEQQQVSFENEQRLIREQKLKLLEIDEYLNAERSKVFEMMRIRKHRIKPYFSGMKSNLDNILEEVEKKGMLSLDYELDTNYTILDAIINIQNNLDEANNLFKALTVETNIGETETFDMRTFLSEYTYNHTIPTVQFVLQKTYPADAPEYPNVQFNRDNHCCPLKVVDVVKS